MLNIIWLTYNGQALLPKLLILIVKPKFVPFKCLSYETHVHFKYNYWLLVKVLFSKYSNNRYDILDL